MAYKFPGEDERRYGFSPALPIHEALVSLGIIGNTTPVNFIATGETEWQILTDQTIRSETSAFWAETVEDERRNPPARNVAGNLDNDHYTKKWKTHKAKKK